MSDDPLRRAIQSATDWQDIANPSSAVDLVAISGGPCRRIRPLADGTLVVKNAEGDTRTMPVTKNVDEDIQAISIEAATDIDCRVYW